jgi:hypothetical protein
MEYGCLYLRVFITCSCSLLGLGQTALDGLEVLQLKLSIDNLFIADGVDSTINVGDILVLETTENVDDSISLTDVSKELIT